MVVTEATAPVPPGAHPNTLGEHGGKSRKTGTSRDCRGPGLSKSDFRNKLHQLRRARRNTADRNGITRSSYNVVLRTKQFYVALRTEQFNVVLRATLGDRKCACCARMHIFSHSRAHCTDRTIHVVWGRCFPSKDSLWPARLGERLSFRRLARRPSGHKLPLADHSPLGTRGGQWLH